MSASDDQHPGIRRLFVLSHEWKVLITLLFICFGSFLFWYGIKVYLDKQWENRITRESEIIEGAIRDNLTSASYLLLDLKSFIELKGLPEPELLEKWMDAKGLDRRMRGVRAIVYAPVVFDADVPSFVAHASARADGKGPLWPQESRPVHFPVTMIQPNDWRNRQAQGYDMASSPERLAAIMDAIARNEPRITDPVVFVSDRDSSTQGFALAVPIMGRGAPANAGDPLRNALGVLILGLSINDFVDGVLGRPTFAKEKLDFSIETATAGDRTARFYDRFALDERTTQAGYDKIVDMAVFGKTWRLTFSPLPHFFSIERFIPPLSAAAMLVFLFLIFYILNTTQRFVRVEESHIRTLAAAAEQTERKAQTLQKLNVSLHALSETPDIDSLYRKLCQSIHEILNFEHCHVYFMLDARRTYRLGFGEGGVLPAETTVKTPLHDFFKDGFTFIEKSTHRTQLERFFPPEFAAALERHEYWFVVPVYSANLSEVHTVIVLTSDRPVEMPDVSLHAVLVLCSQFGTSYEKAILLQKAHEANITKSFFLANISHEIRTPLNAVIGFSEILLESEEASPEKQAYLENIKRNGRQLTRLIDDVLDISKAEMGEFKIEAAEFDLEHLMEELRSLFAPKFREKGVEFTIAKTSGVPQHLVSDDIRLRQILMNLISNALKFTEAGSVKLLYKVKDDGHFIEFQVQDTGVGIRPEDHRNLFMPFFQGDVGHTRRYGGSGLGLSLSRKIANTLGGDLVLTESAPGDGATFTLTVPLEKRHRPGRAPQGRAFVESESRPRLFEGDRMLAGAKILLVEDSKDNQLIFEHFLQSAGAEIAIVENGEEAVARALADSPDIVLMDIQLPVMDGKKATRALRERGFRKPIVALTAHAFAEEVESCIRAGCNGQITKPVAKQQLIEQVHFFLHHKGPSFQERTIA